MVNHYFGVFDHDPIHHQPEHLLFGVKRWFLAQNSGPCHFPQSKGARTPENAHLTS